MSPLLNGHHTSSPLPPPPPPLNPLPQPSFATQAIHTGSSPDPTTGAIIPAISLSTTFLQLSPGSPFPPHFHEYSRSSNPNRTAFEALLAGLEVGGGEALAFSSGSAATAIVVQSLGFLGGKAHVVCVNDVYGGTYRYLKAVAGKLQGLEVTFLDMEDVDEEVVRDAIRDDTKLIWLESPTNPTLKLIDVTKIAKIAHAHPSQPFLLVDNTFLSPFYSNPLTLGADIVLHSVTKYINGHSDVVMGAVVLPFAALPSPSPHSSTSTSSSSPSSPNFTSNPTSHSPNSQQQATSLSPHPSPHRLQSLLTHLRFLQNASGAIPSPYDCWLAHRGAKTLHLRMKQSGLAALKVAGVLRGVLGGDERNEEVRGILGGDERNEEESGKIPRAQIIYPGLPGTTEEEKRKNELAWRILSRHAKKWILEEVVPLLERDEEVLMKSKSKSESKFKSELPLPTLNGSTTFGSSYVPNGFGLGTASLSPSPSLDSNSADSDLELDISSDFSSPPRTGFPFSGMLSLILPTQTEAHKFLGGLTYFSLAESLGGVESLGEHPWSMTHVGMRGVSGGGEVNGEVKVNGEPNVNGKTNGKTNGEEGDKKHAIGVHPGLVRLSVGVEDVNDLVSDVLRGVEGLRK